MSSVLFSGRRVMWMPLSLAWRGAKPDRICCATMSAALDFRCEQHEQPFDCPDALVIYHEVFDEFGLLVHDGGPSYVLIAHCPWCGGTLPESQRDKWFDALEARGIDEVDGDAVPPEFLTAAWRSPAPPGHEGD